MNGINLLQTLNELGYVIEDDVSPESVDWMFADRMAIPFLDWFCCNLDPSTNLLTSEELKQFAKLEECGDVLEGDQLTDAHDNLVIQDKESVDLDIVEAEIDLEISFLRSELQRGECQFQSLVQIMNHLNVQHTFLTHRISQMCSLHEVAEEAYKKQMKCQTDDDVFDVELNQLSACVSDLINLFSLSSSENTSKASLNEESLPCNIFLSHQQMNLYVHAKDKLMKDMAAFTQKQFFEGIAEIACCDSTASYQVLDISQSNYPVVDGKMAAIAENTNELARLRENYKICELCRISEIMLKERVTAQLSYTQNQLHSYQIPGHCGDLNTLKNKLLEAQQKFSRLCDEKSTLMDTKIVTLVNHCANSQSVMILQGDYDLKIARQDYFISSQDKVIHQLIKQQSQYEFLAMSYVLEIKNHHSVHQLLSAITLDLKSCLQSLHSRLKLVSHPQLMKQIEEKTVIDSDDGLLQNIHQIIDCDSNNEPLYRTYDHLSASAKKLSHDLAAAESCDSYLCQDGNEKLKKLEKLMKSYESRLYSESSTLKGLPQLSPRQLTNVLKLLDSTVEKFEKALLDITKEIKVKRAILEKDPLLQDERKLFVKFLKEPLKLQLLMDELSARVDARAITK